MRDNGILERHWTLFGENSTIIAKTFSTFFKESPETETIIKDRFKTIKVNAGIVGVEQILRGIKQSK